MMQRLAKPLIVQVGLYKKKNTYASLHPTPLVLANVAFMKLFADPWMNELEGKTYFEIFSWG